jgi:cardiolipin synthase
LVQIENRLLVIYGVVTVIVYLAGIANAAHAVMTVRSSRGAIAWSISLLTIPWVALPFYWVFGRNHFFGYREILRSAFALHRERVRDIYRELQAYQIALPEQFASLERLAMAFEGIAFTGGNCATLLIDGPETFKAMLQAIADARTYILLQTYIIHDDETGQVFQQALIKKAQQGVRIHLLYDEIGCQKTPKAYFAGLRQAGVQVSAFHTTKGWGNRFQLNFRNHRKILVVDGVTAFVGGLNIGDEYAGKDAKLSPWRDTHLQLCGPSVQVLQGVFLQDWYWATRQILEVNWQATVDRATNATVLIFATGPADALPACNLFFVNVINQAQHRLWIASPYFVPDDSTLAALKLAALRGVDVRILLPNRPDHLLVYLCSFSYYSELDSVGIKLYRYKQGFMHQKCLLVDRAIAAVGTTNLDNRSFFLNFEVMSFLTHPDFVQQVEQMLQSDLSASVAVNLDDYKRRSLGFQLIVRASRLLSPIL